MTRKNANVIAPAAVDNATVAPPIDEASTAPVYPPVPSSLTSSASRHDILNSLVRRNLDGRDLPEIVNGEPLGSFLASFRGDQAPFGFDLAGRMGLQSHPPTFVEAALTLKARLKL